MEYTRDHLGSIRELTDNTQAVRARYDYDPYGRMTKIQGDKDSPFTYTGHFWHAQSGLNLALYRAYDPNLGRWISRDPLEEEGGINLYGYVDNSPMNYIDIDGLYKFGPKAGRPISDQLDTALTCFEKCLGKTVTLSRANDTGHSPGSAHSEGNACDINSRGLPRPDVEKCFKECFGSRGFGQEEFNRGNDPAFGTHYHLQTRPGRRNSTGFRSGIAPNRVNR